MMMMILFGLHWFGSLEKKRKTSVIFFCSIHLSTREWQVNQKLKLICNYIFHGECLFIDINSPFFLLPDSYVTYFWYFERNENIRIVL